MATELRDRGREFDWRIGEPGEINYYMPWWMIAQHGRKGKFDILFYTHCTKENLPIRDEVLRSADLIIAMTEADARELREAGFESTYIKAGIDPRFRPEIRIGICGRPYADGRKRHWIPAQLSTMMNLDNFRFVIWGQNWDNIVDDLRARGVRCDYHNNPDFAEYPKIMRSCDVLLVTEKITGGPQALTEALASGVSVISPRVGYALEFDTPEIAYYETMDELRDLLKDMEGRITSRTRLVEDRTWANWTRDHEALIRSKLDEV